MISNTNLGEGNETAAKVLEIKIIRLNLNFMNPLRRRKLRLSAVLQVISIWHEQIAKGIRSVAEKQIILTIVNFYERKLSELE